MFGDDDFGRLPAAAAAPVADAEPRRALYLRWRPLRFEDVVGQEHVTRTLRNASMGRKLAHAYLFTGPRGTGKTSVARILYRAANCPNLVDGDPCNQCPSCRAALEGRSLDLVEIDAASNRGIDDVRDIRDKVAYRPSEGRYRLYILDEAHEFTTPAWDAFLKTLEEPPAHAIFVMATTEAHKVPATIVSRCQRFDFRRIPFEASRDQLVRIAAAEGLDVDLAVLERIARAARGGLRDALSLLDQLTTVAGAHVDMAVAQSVLGLPAAETVHAVVAGLTRRDAATVMAQVADVAEGGADLRQFVEELITAMRALLLVRAGADARLATELPADDVERLRRLAPSWTVGGLSAPIQELTNALARTRDAQQFQVQIELALLAACAVPEAQPTTGAPVASAEAPLPAVSVASPSPAPPAPPVDVPSQEPVPAPTPAESPPAPAELAMAVATVATSSDALALARDRWPRVVEYVKREKPFLGVPLSSAHLTGVEDSCLTVAFASEFNRKRADTATNRRTIEDGVRQELGGDYRVRCVLSSSVDLFADPVISYAASKFGGEPRRVSSEQPAPIGDPSRDDER